MKLKFWQWYACLTIIATINIIALIIFLVKIKAKDLYSKLCKYLAMPWVVECAWRSFFPSLYLQRFVVWNVWMNAIFVDRCWACLGELSWSYQISNCLRQQDIDINNAGLGTTWIQLSGWLSFFSYVIAECISYYNVATTNEWWAAAEVIVDGLAFLIMFPAALYLFIQQWHYKWSSGKMFCLILAIITVVYPIYNIFIDAPMYMKRYKEDQGNHKKYLRFWPGLIDSFNRRIVTHEIKDWSDDMTWMLCYFLFGAWSGMVLMYAPHSKRPSSEDDNKNEPLLLQTTVL